MMVAKLIAQGFIYMNFQSDKNGSKSQTSYVFTLNNGAISWNSFKQGIITNYKYNIVSKAIKKTVKSTSILLNSEW